MPLFKKPRLLGWLTLACIACIPLAVLWTGCKKGGEMWPGRSRSNLEQIGTAIHMFHHDYSQLPPGAIYDKDGNPLLSWRVLILRYVEEEELYKQFKLDEPWDSEHNKKLLDKMPSVYASGGAGAAETSKTYYQGFNGPGAVFETHPRQFGVRRSTIESPHLESHLYECGPKLTLHHPSFPDMTSNTIAIVEAGEPTPWTKPADITFNPENPPFDLQGPYQGGFYALFMDSSVEFIKKGYPAGTLGGFIDRRDGTPVRRSDLVK